MMFSTEGGGSGGSGNGAVAIAGAGLSVSFLGSSFEDAVTRSRRMSDKSDDLCGAVTPDFCGSFEPASVERPEVDGPTDVVIASDGGSAVVEPLVVGSLQCHNNRNV